MLQFRARFTACWGHVIWMTTIIYFNLRCLLCSFSLLLLSNFINLPLTLLNTSPKSHLFSTVIIAHLLVLFYSLHFLPILVSCLRAFELVHHLIIGLWSLHWEFRLLMCKSFVEYMSRSICGAVTLWKIHWLVSFIYRPFLLISRLNLCFRWATSPLNLRNFDLFLLL